MTALRSKQQRCGKIFSAMFCAADFTEYLYQVLEHNGHNLPKEALYIIRYHSFYPWHTCGDYTHLMNNKDQEDIKWINEFK